MVMMMSGRVMVTDDEYSKVRLFCYTTASLHQMWTCNPCIHHHGLDSDSELPVCI